MSTRYKNSDHVPDDVLADRLDELAEAVAKRDMSEFYMRIPAELDHDADLVLSEAAKRIRAMRQDTSVPFDASEPEWRPRAQTSPEPFWVWTNSDLNEGRGSFVLLGKCETEAEARELAKGRGPMGQDADILPLDKAHCSPYLMAVAKALGAVSA